MYKENQFGLIHKIGGDVVQKRLSEQAVVGVPPRPARFTAPEWQLVTAQRLRNTLDQQQLADLVLAEGQKVRDETKEKATSLKDRTDKLLDDRINDVNFNKEELCRQRKEICLELENLDMIKKRLLDCLKSFKDFVQITRKCLILRDGRIGIDLVVDDADLALQEEADALLGGQSILSRGLEQLNEQMRRLRAVRHLLDRDLHYKQDAINIDKDLLSLNSSSLCLSIYEGFKNLDPSNISSAEYDAYSENNIRNAAKEVNSSRPIRMYIDGLLKQVINDLKSAYKKSNHELNERIIATKFAMNQMIHFHKEITKKIFNMKANVEQLQKALTEKEGHIALVHTRLGRRAQRAGLELVRDSACQGLEREAGELRAAVEQLQDALGEASASLRYLLQAQLQLEEDINVKLNTIKIDEVDCMTLRASIEYNYY